MDPVAAAGGDSRSASSGDPSARSSTSMSSSLPAAPVEPVTQAPVSEPPRKRRPLPLPPRAAEAPPVSTPSPVAAAAAAAPSDRSEPPRVANDRQTVPGPDVKAYALEIMCGSAGLTAALREVGFHADGVDYHRCRFKQPFPIMHIDLSTESGKAQFFELLLDPRLAFVHFAPACGTASRAREYPVPGGHAPAPLRSESHPEGLPDLANTNPRDLIRVQAANRLYQLVAEAAVLLHSRGIAFVIENPKNSLFWWFPAIAQLTALPGCADIVYQSCMHGGSRPKWQRLRAFPAEHFRALNLLCDGKHRHLRWGLLKKGGFSTSNETAYPRLFCQRLAEAAKAAAIAMGKWSPSPRLLPPPCARPRCPSGTG